MTCDTFRRFRKSIQILGLVLVSVFYSAQSLAFIIFGGDERQPELIIEQNSPATIPYLFTLTATRLGLDFYEVSFHDKDIPLSLQYPQVLEVPMLEGLVENDTITFDGDKKFILESWSGQYRDFGATMTFEIPFLRSALEDWIREKEANNEVTELSFYVVGHGFKLIPGWAITSSHKVTIPIRKQDYAHISGLKDIILPQSNDKGFCVSSTTGNADTGGKITLRVTSTDSAFELLPQTSGDPAAGSYSIGYSITLKGNSSGPKEEVLNQPGSSAIEWEAHHANFLDEDCNQGHNMSLFIKMDGTEVNAPTGKYTDDVTITVAPAS